MLFTFFLSIEAVWFSCDSYQRQQLLESLGRDDLALIIQLDPYYPLLPQIYLLRLEDHERSIEEMQQERFDKSSETNNSKKNVQTPLNSDAKSQEANDSEEGWKVAGKRYAAKMLCHRPKTQNLDNVKKQKIYKWIDEKGRTHFGEKPSLSKQNPNNEVEDLSKQYASLQQEVKLTIEYPNWAGDSFIESEIKKQGKMVHKVLSHYVPKVYQRQINLKIILFKDVKEFDAHRDAQKANAQWGAYYSSVSNSIYLPRYPNIEQTMAIARHEMTHAMLAGMIGPVPVWLNEGLAEYMESFSWQMNTAIAQPRFDQYGRLENASMKNLAATEHQDFYGSNQSTNYLQAGATLYFLLDHQAGREWLKRSFAFYGQNPCRKVSGHQLFSQTYPGGIEGASDNFQSWLSKGKFPTHRY